ncbi:Glycosyl transferase [Carnimonas sp. R-84981]|uniref:glycosyltransferase family 2 protein n=1 Tax=Carnimonas bestiolae TaxID=3402172 RepID=UPI003EDBE1B7
MTFKTFFLETLPLKLGLNTSPRLSSIGMVKCSADDDISAIFSWESTGDEAYFHSEKALPRVGFNMLEIEIEHDQTSAAAGITFDRGNGFDRRNTIYLAVRRGRVAKRICYVPWGIKGIRLEPLSGKKGSFSIRRFRFIWLTPRFAHSRMLRRLNYADRHFQGAGERKIYTALRQESQEEGVNWRRLLTAYYEGTFARGAPNFNYALWREQIEPLREPSNNRVSIAIEKLTEHSNFGIAIASQGASIDDVATTVDSLISQRYSRWYLLVTAEQNADSDIQALLAQRLEQHEDLAAHLLIQPSDGDGAFYNWITSLSDQLDYISVLAAGDALASNATYHLAAHSFQHPDAALLYGDEDRRIDGERSLPNFKPEWNADLLLSVNYMGRAVAFSSQRLLQFIQPIKSFEDVDLHALLLAFTDALPKENIQHVAYIILHRRYSDTTSAAELSPNGPGYSRSAVSQFLKEKNADVVVSEQIGVGCRVQWNLPETPPSVTLLIPTRDMVHMLRPCVNRILELTDYPNFDIIILDNQSSDPEALAYLNDIEHEARVRVLRWNHPFNYSAVNNFGARHCQSDIIGLVNNDIEPINSGWLTEMVSHAIRPEIGCVGAKLYYPDDTLQHAGVILGLGGVAGHAHRFFPRSEGGFQNRLNHIQNLSAVTAACLLLRRDLFEMVGGLEEEHLPVAYNDVDLCLKVRELGYRNLWTPFAELYHHESVSRGADDNPAKKARAKREVDYFRGRWADQLLHDPAYNPNLTVSFEDFSLR